MTTFEFVFGLISVITSLALTQLVSGLVSFARKSAKVTWSLRHALWMWVAFALVIANWAGFWDRRDLDWNAFELLRALVLVITLYAFCALVVPETEKGAPIDLRAFHENEGSRYMLAQVVFSVAVIANFMVTSTSVNEWLMQSSFAWIALVLAIIAVIARPVWLQQAVATLLGLLAAFFLAYGTARLGA